MGRWRERDEPDERVLLAARPHWLVLVPTVVVMLIVLGAVVAGLLAWQNAPLWFGGVLGLVLLVVVVRLASRVVQWRFAVLSVTEARVQFRSGVLRRSGRELPLRRIADVTFHQSILDRIVGSGDLTITATGGSGSISVTDVRAPKRVQRLVHDAIDLQDDERNHPARPAAGSPDPPPLRALEPLQRLLERGAITETEFEELSSNGPITGP